MFEGQAHSVPDSSFSFCSDRLGGWGGCWLWLPIIIPPGVTQLAHCHCYPRRLLSDECPKVGCLSYITRVILTYPHIFCVLFAFLYQLYASFLSWFQVLSRITSFFWKIPYGSWGIRKKKCMFSYTVVVNVVLCDSIHRSKCYFETQPREVTSSVCSRVPFPSNYLP